MSKKRKKNPEDSKGPDDDLRWFNEVYRPRFSSDAAMIADLDQQLARFKEEHPEDPDADSVRRVNP
jgi:hypothetical protein